MLLDIPEILKDFPKIELSYETMVHKKVHHSDLMIAIPEGKKYFAWFTVYKQHNVCFLLETGDYKKIVHVSVATTSFKDELSYGTILYGTIFKYDHTSCFSVENIVFYKGSLLPKHNFLNKLQILNHLLKNEISQMAIHRNFIIFALPFFKIGNDFKQLLNEIEVLPYKIKTIQFIKINHTKSHEISCMNYFKPGYQYKNTSNQIHHAIFKVVPDIQNDIYHLHMYNNGNYEFYDIAHIPDYKTSVLMNKIFRKIKENDNLDALEESDSEDEFENERLDKFVYLDKWFKMNCIYNHKFKKWTPLCTVKNNEKVITKKELGASAII